MSSIQRDTFKILKNSEFDLIFSILFYLEDVSLTVRKELIQLLTSGLKSLFSFIEKKKLLAWAEINFISTSTVNQLLRDVPQCEMAINSQNALSAYVYLITWFLSENCRLKEYKEANLTKGKRKVAKKDKTKD